MKFVERIDWSRDGRIFVCNSCLKASHIEHTCVTATWHSSLRFHYNVHREQCHFMKEKKYDFTLFFLTILFCFVCLLKYYTMDAIEFFSLVLFHRRGYIDNRKCCSLILFSLLSFICWYAIGLSEKLNLHFSGRMFTFFLFQEQWCSSHISHRTYHCFNSIRYKYAQTYSSHSVSI